MWSITWGMGWNDFAWIVWDVGRILWKSGLEIGKCPDIQFPTRYLKDFWLTNENEVPIMYSWHMSTGKERRTIMIARNLEANHLIRNNGERIVLLALR